MSNHPYIFNGRTFYKTKRKQMATQVTHRKKPLYTFKSKPTPARNPWKRYRGTGTDENYDNIMHDRHIVRGSNWSRYKVVPGINREQHLTYAEKRARKEREMFLQVQQTIARRHKSSTTQTLCDLVPIDIPVDKDDYPRMEREDRPPSPKCVPRLSKKSKHTQVGAGDFFVFDVEARPIVEVVVGKVVDQSVIELMEEEEIEVLREREKRFNYLRNCETIAKQALEAQHKRLNEEKARRFRQEREAKERENELAGTKVVRSGQKDCAENVERSTYEKLTNAYFCDRLRHDIETNFLPFLSNQTSKTLTATEQARQVLDIIIRDVVERRMRDDLFGYHDALSYTDLSCNCLEDFESFGSFESGDFRGGEILDAPSQHNHVNDTSHRKQTVKS